MQHLHRLLLASLLLAGFTAPLEAQAYCALRDPDAQIRALFPTSTTYRSIVRTIDEETREAVGKRLPFTLHFNELGRHTTYVAYRDQRPLGLVHVRSEAGRWGLVEVAWALSLDLELEGYVFQRCRDRQATALEEPQVRKALHGLDVKRALALLDKQGEALVPGGLEVPAKAEPLAAVLLRNGLKTLVAVEHAWGEDVLRAGALARAQDQDPSWQVEPIAVPYAQATLDTLDGKLGAKGSGIQRNQVAAFAMVDEQGRHQGHVLRLPWRQGRHALDLWWVSGPEGRVNDLRARGGWPRPDLQETFECLIGTRPDTTKPCSSPVEMVALEAALLCGGQHPTAR